MISVIVCTHNPREEYLKRVLAGLKSQTLPKTEWELLLIDNRSLKPLAECWDLSWHPNARHIREERLGLTPARLRGIRESRGEFLIFVDDDNVLSCNYLSVVVEISLKHPQIGAFGASIKGEFEQPCPAWMEKYLEFLAIRELQQDYWANVVVGRDALPFGAGLCIQRVVAEDYERKARVNPIRMALDRTGVGLGAGGDGDLVFCALDIGMGTGRFHDLQLTHLIPRGRMTKEYIRKLIAGMSGSREILDHLRPRARRPELLRFLWNMLRGSAFDRRIEITACRERKKARDFLAGKRDSL